MRITHHNLRAIELQLPRFAAAASVPIVFALAVLLAARRVAGAMTTPLAPLPLFLTAAALLLWLWCIRILLGGRPQNRIAHTQNWQSHLFQWAPFASLVLFAYACSYPGARIVDWLFWLSAIALAWFDPPAFELRHAAAAPQLRIHGKPPAEMHAPDEQILQQLTRIRTSDGRVAIRGTLAAEFIQGQRSADLYVSFCPPFEHMPEVDTELADPDQAAVHLTQVLHHGAQLEVRLPRPALGDTTILVEVYASAAAAG